MRKLFLLLVTSIFIISCGNKNQNIAKTYSETFDDHIEILYCHTKRRCITCNAIENLTKEVVDNYQINNNKNIILKIIDISTTEGEKIADKYEVSWSSLFINKWHDGKETINNLTDFAFSHAKNSPEIFKTGIKDKIEELQK